MRNKLFLAFFVVLSVLFLGTSTALGQEFKKGIPKFATNPHGFIPTGYALQEELKGDLNKDGLEDVVLLIKSTAPDNLEVSKYYDDRYLDLNRRGLIIAFKKDKVYELKLLNAEVFDSDEEEGSDYFSPDIAFEIKKGNLHIRYMHGRYGFWEYNFNYRQGAFRLIGYEFSSNRGPVVLTETSINFLTNRKLVRKNEEEKHDLESSVFTEEWFDVDYDVITLDEIEDLEGYRFRN